MGLKVLTRMSAGDQRDAAFRALVPQLTHLIADRQGSVVFARVLEQCTDDEMHIILRTLLDNPDMLVQSLRGEYGANSMMKLLIKSLNKSDMARSITNFLAWMFKTLMVNKASCGVIVKCFELLDNDANEVLYKAMIHDCVELATNEVACFAINESFEHMKQPYKDRVLTEIVSQVRFLSQDPSGSFVVQKLMELNERELDKTISSSLKGCFANFCMQKASSSVVEKCLETDLGTGYVLRDLVDCVKLEQIAGNPFGTRVIQKALIRAAQSEENIFLCCILTSKLDAVKEEFKDGEGKSLYAFIDSFVFRVDANRLINDLSSFRLF